MPETDETKAQLLTTTPIKEVTVDWIQHKEEGIILEIFQQLPPAGKVNGRGNWVPNSHQIYIYLLENKIGVLYEEMAYQVLRSPSQGPKQDTQVPGRVWKS